MWVKETRHLSNTDTAGLVRDPGLRLGVDEARCGVRWQPGSDKASWEGGQKKGSPEMQP